jgi:uncharacterized protein YrrD
MVAAAVRCLTDAFRLGGKVVIMDKNTDGSVLGCMNDMVFLCERVIAQSGGLAGDLVRDREVSPYPLVGVRRIERRRITSMPPSE